MEKLKQFMMCVGYSHDFLCLRLEITLTEYERRSLIS